MRVSGGTCQRQASRPWAGKLVDLPAFGGRGAQMYYFYAIRSLKDGSIYKGISSDPLRRLKEHNSQKSRSTKTHVPYELVCKVKCDNSTEARKLEIFYKSGVGRQQLKNIIEKSG